MSSIHKLSPLEEEKRWDLIDAEILGRFLILVHIDCDNLQVCGMTVADLFENGKRDPAGA